MKTGIVAGLLIALTTATAAAETPPVEGAKPAVLVTGASTGIGRNITERLAAEGYLVYAGARKDSDLAELDAIENVESVRLDVTRADEIDDAVRKITASGRGLYGVVNNAGIGTLGPLTQVPENELKFVFDVNVYGPYRITKAFAPLLLESRGRVTTISSIAGILSREGLGVYSMSKHAIEAFGDALAAELEPRGVKVSLIEPGNYNSEIVRNAEQRLGVSTGRADRSKFKDPDEVADAVLHALFDPNPKRRYMVVPNAAEAEATIGKAIEELVQLNERQAYTYDRAALIEMLDAALAKSAGSR